MARPTIRVTTDHPESKYGMPVIVDSDGVVVPYSAGIKVVRSVLGLSQSGLAEQCGVSVRTVQGWELEAGRPVPATALNVMGDLLRRHQG